MPQKINKKNTSSPLLESYNSKRYFPKENTQNQRSLGLLTGFTIIELSISITIGAILLLSLVGIYLTNQNAYQIADTRAEITQNGRVIMDRLVRDLRQTEKIVTTLPENNSDHANLPSEILFQDGHDTDRIRYIRYYLENSQFMKQVIAYYFSIDSTTYVLYNTTDQDGLSPSSIILEEKIMGEYIDDIEFWGRDQISVNLELKKNNQTETIYTAVYGRNL